MLRTGAPWRDVPEITWSWWQRGAAVSWRWFATSIAIGISTALVGLLTGLQFFGLLTPGESAALILGALITIAVATVSGGRAVANGLTAGSGD